MKVVRQATDKDFAELRINLITRAKGLLPNTLERVQLFFVLE